MAEFLIKAIDATHLNSAKDKMCYKKGDVVQVMENGTCTEPVSPNSNMFIVKIPDMTMKESEKFTASITTGTGATLEPVTRRQWKIDIDSLSISDKTTLSETKELTITKAKIEPCLMDKEG